MSLKPLRIGHYYLLPQASRIDVAYLSGTAFSPIKTTHEAKNKLLYYYYYLLLFSPKQHNSNNNDTHVPPIDTVPRVCLTGSLAFAWFLVELSGDSPLCKNPDLDIGDTRKGGL